MAKIHIGTSGWSYKHWKEIFYPQKMKATDYLQFYSTHFNVTEINSSFYRLPISTTIDHWIEQVPDDFFFCPKMSRYLSHMKKLNDPEEPLARFFKLFEPMKKQMGPVLIQLPANASFNESRDRRFYEILEQLYPEYSFAMEVRHESWYSADSLNQMEKYNIAFVIAQSDRFPYQEFVTANDIYIRFHGPDALYASPYTMEVLEKYAEKFLSWKAAGHNVWVFFNNDIDGHALTNAKQLIGMVEPIANN